MYPGTARTYVTADDLFVLASAWQQSSRPVTKPTAMISKAWRPCRMSNLDRTIAPLRMRVDTVSHPRACVTGSNFNKFPAACKSAELIDWTHKQLKRITFVKQQVYSVCEPRKISYINKLTKDNISISIKATQYEPN